jgi:hypothetical protein
MEKGIENPACQERWEPKKEDQQQTIAIWGTSSNNSTVQYLQQIVVSL